MIRSEAQTVNIDQTPMPMSKESDWDRAANLGRQIVLDGLVGKTLRRWKRGADPWDALALGFGACKGVAEYLMVASRPDARRVLEENLIAVIRGVLREAGEPINDDGSPYSESDA